MSLHGSINHVSITVSDLESAISFFGPLLEFLGYAVGAVSTYKGDRLTVNVNESNGIAINIWEARTSHEFDVYEPGLHHLALNAGSREQVDEVHRLVVGLGAEILDGPGEFPFAHGGYYAVYFLGPDGMKFEIVYMPELDGQGNNRRVRTNRFA